MPEVSIIIPVYNAEKYLKECMDSVVNQTLKDIEIICINDGSTDNSLEILNEYAKNDKRIKIIDKKNTGCGNSMNIGLDNAKGEYMGIVESDDYVDLNMYEKLYNLGIKYDAGIIRADFYKFYKKSLNRLSLFQKIFSIRNEYSGKKVFKVLTLFGLKLKWRSRAKEREIENQKQKNMTADFLYYENLAKRHHTLIFKKYENINKGKDLVIFACGPSAKYYRPIKNAVHISVNRAFYFPKIKFEYMFFHDLEFVEENSEKIKGYDAEKFCAYHTNQNNALKFNTSSEKLKYINAKRFYLSAPDFRNPCKIIPDVINPDITSGMFYDRGGGTVFSALQFALYTHPERIYLVGCDCSSDGYFYSEQSKNILLCGLSMLWAEAAYSIQMLYPDIEIISINPAGLKGMFKDIYTNDNGEYTDDYGNIINPNADIKKEDILKG